MSFDISYNFQAIDNFSSVSRRIGNQINGLSGKINKFNSRFTKVGESMSKLGRNISMKVGAPLAVFAALSTRTAFSFQKAMNMVHADTDSTIQQFKMLRAEAMKLGETTQFTATQVAQAEMFLGRAGKKSAEIMAVLPKVLQLAAAAQLDMGGAANIVVQIMSSYNLKAKDLSNVNNMLVKAFTSSNVNLQMLGQSFKLAGPVLGASGIKFHAAAAALGVLGNAGMQATMAGTGLRRGISMMLNPTAAMKKGMKEAGITFTKTNGTLRPLVKIIGDLHKKGLTAAGAMAMFGLRGGPAILSLVNHYPDLVKLNKALQHTGQIAQRIGTAQMRGLVGATYRLRSAFQALQLNLVDAVQPNLIGFMRTLTHYLRGAAASSSGTKKLAGYMIGLGIAIGPVLLTVGKIVLVLSFLMKNVPIVSTVVAGLGLAFKFLWRSLLGPIGVALTAISVFMLLYKKFQIIRAGVAAVSQAFEGNFVPIIKIAIEEFEKLGKIFEWVWDKIHGRAIDVGIHHQMVAASGGGIAKGVASGIYQHKVQSTLDVNVGDPGGYIKNIFGKSSDKLNVSLGTNMLEARS